MKFKKLYIALLSAIILIPTFAFAVNFQAGEDVFSNIKVINDDFYVAGGLVQIESDVNGDLMVAGGKIFIDSTVSGDLTVTGGEIIIQGEVKDDARLAGGNVTISAPVKDDLIIGAGNITINSKASVGGDLIFGGGNVIINGPVSGNIVGGGGNVHINNTVKGNVNLYGVDKLTFGPSAVVTGNLVYKSPKVSKTVSKDVVKGTIEYKAIKKMISKKDAKNIGIGIIAGLSIFQLLSLLFVGLFFIWGLRFYVQRSVETSSSQALKSFGIGLAVLVLTPIAALISAITGIGLLLSLILMLVWVVMMIAGKIMAAAIIGMKIVKVNDKSSFLRVYGAFALGALIYVLLTLIPVIGWLAKCILVSIGIGAMAIYENGLFQSLRKAKKI